MKYLFKAIIMVLVLGSIVPLILFIFMPRYSHKYRGETVKEILNSYKTDPYDNPEDNPNAPGRIPLKKIPHY